MQHNTEECGSPLQPPENFTIGKNNQCRICHKIFAYTEGLRIHMTLHTGDKPYQCRYCDSSFVFLCDLQVHSRIHSAGKRHACMFCGKFIVNKYALKLHLRQHTGEKPHSCHFCEAAFARRSDLRKHTRVHTKEQLYKCRYCNRTFSQLHSAKYHEETHAIEKFSCTDCGCVFSHRSGFVRHLRIHAHTGKENCLCKVCFDGTITYDKVNKVFNCFFCAASFSRLDRLKVHMKSRGEQIHSCKTCSLNFCTENSLYEHLKTHERTYVCQFCEQAFLLKTELLLHIDRHTHTKLKSRMPKTKEPPYKRRCHEAIEKKYRCTECDGAFVKRSGLERHARIHAHTGKGTCLCKVCFDGTTTYDKVNKVLNCPFCAASFSRLDRLRVHMNSRGEHIHSCKICDSTFCTKNSLYEHLETHERTYVCQFCDQAFMLRTQLLVHIERHAAKKHRTNRNTHICKHCPLVFDDRTQLLIHISSQHASDETHQYTCSYCQKSYLHEEGLLRHERSHSADELSYLCFLCTRSFLTKDELVAHVQNHNDASDIRSELFPFVGNYHGRKLYSCSSCDKSFTRRSDLRRHALCHAEKPYVCQYCNKAFPSGSELVGHIQGHYEVKQVRFFCRCCEKSFKRNYDCRKHERTHSYAELSYQCQSCEISFQCRDEWLAHWSRHTEEKRHRCECCGKSFRRLHDLRRHRQSHSNDEPLGDQLSSGSLVDTEVKRHFCKCCAKSFKRNYERRKHERTHSSAELSYYCQSCDIQFKYRNEWLAHRSSHIERERHCCEYCSKSFKFLCDLKKHSVIHFDTKPFSDQIISSKASLGSHLLQLYKQRVAKKQFSCQCCDKSFTCELRLGLHERKHSADDLPYRCQSCTRSFLTRIALLDHFLTHKDKQHTCTYCFKSFSCRYYLRRHEMCHNMKKEPHVCLICRKEFAHQSRLILHMRCHVKKKQKQFSCKSCDKVYLRKCSLEKHEVKHVSDR